MPWNDMTKIRFDLAKRPWGIRKYQRPDGSIDVEVYKKDLEKQQKTQKETNESLERNMR